MKAFSIRQPWAYAILKLQKDIENRDWRTNFRGRVLLHTGKKIDKGGIGDLVDMGMCGLPKIYKTGGIIGSVEIVDCVSESNSKWFFGRYGFVLRNAAPLPFMPYRGQLGFFEVDYNPEAAQKNTTVDLQTATNTEMEPF